MRCEWPEFKRCCLCLPLRRGILGIAYMKVAIDLFISFVIIMNIAYRAVHYFKWFDIFTILMCITATFFILDTIFHVLIVIGGHMKNYKFMRIFFRCAICILVLDILFPLAFIIIMLVFMFIYQFVFVMMLPTFVFLLLLFCINLLLHIYLSSLVRSEMLKLKNHSQYEFTNRTETLRETTSELQEV